MLYVALLLMFTAGFLVGVVVKNARPDLMDLNKDGKVDLEDTKIVLDLNKDGKVDAKDLEVAKTEMKKVASTVQTIKSQVTKK